MTAAKTQSSKDLSPEHGRHLESEYWRSYPAVLIAGLSPQVASLSPTSSNYGGPAASEPCPCCLRPSAKEIAELKAGAYPDNSPIAEFWMRVDRLALNYSRGLTYSNPFYKNGDDVVSECIFVCDGCTKMAQIPGAEVRFVGSCLSSFFWLGDHAGHLDRVRRLE